MTNLEITTSTAVNPNSFRKCFEFTPLLHHAFRRRLTHREGMAIRQRNDALLILKTMGILKISESKGLCLEFTDGVIDACLYMCSHQFPENTGHPVHAVCRRELKEQIQSYVLDIRQGGKKKVFSIAWNNDAAFQLIKFKRGMWEERIGARAALIVLDLDKSSRH